MAADLVVNKQCPHAILVNVSANVGVYLDHTIVGRVVRYHTPWDGRISRQISAKTRRAHPTDSDGAGKRSLVEIAFHR